MRYLIASAVVAILVTPAFAQAPVMPASQPPKSYQLSAPLVEELFQRLNAAALAAMLQSEVQHQPPPVTCPEAIPLEPKDNK